MITCLYVGLLVPSAVVFHVYMFLLCFYVLCSLTDCAVVFYSMSDIVLQ